MGAFFNSFVDARLVLGISFSLLEAFFNCFMDAEDFFGVLIVSNAVENILAAPKLPTNSDKEVAKKESEERLIF